MFTVGCQGTEYDAGKIPDLDRLLVALAGCRRVEVAERLEANGWCCRKADSLRIDAQAVRKVGCHESIVPGISGRIQEARGIRRLKTRCNFRSLTRSHEIGSANYLSGPDLGLLESKALALHDHVEDAIGFRAGAIGLGRSLVPAPVACAPMRRIRARNVWATLAPIGDEGIKDTFLLPAHSILD
jgi:hypothetical protein